MSELTSEFYTEMKRISYSLQNMESDNSKRKLEILGSQREIVESIKYLNKDVIEINSNLEELNFKIENQIHRINHSEFLSDIKSLRESVEVIKLNSYVSSQNDILHFLKSTNYIIFLPIWFVIVIKIFNFFGVHIL